MDGRHQRGEQTRHTVAESAAALASIDGLAGITLSQVARSLGVSKSSIQAAYPTKQELQLATIAAATEIFVTAVITPAQQAPEGLARLWSLIDRWLEYIDDLVLPGGCFMGATLAEFDSRPGEVRQALQRARRGWLSALERQAAIAQSADDIPSEPSADMIAFEVDALLAAANVARNITDDTTPLATARALIAMRLQHHS
jgi:AcrR family transcriptional regulator